MLTEFIITNREKLIARTRAKVEERPAPRPTAHELENGVPHFLDQLVEALRHPASSNTDAIDRTAAVHGGELLDLGYTVSQVVHDYGDICQAVTELAEETDAAITTDEFHVLNLCLDNAIAEAVAAYTRLRQQSVTGSETERSGVFAHELRNRLQAVQLGFATIESGRAPAGGSVGRLVRRNLLAMTTLIDQALADVRLSSGNTLLERIHVHRLIEEAEVDGTMAARAHGVSLSVTPTDPAVDVEADPQILAAAIFNLLQNAFKFTHPGGHVRSARQRWTILSTSPSRISAADYHPAKPKSCSRRFSNAGTIAAVLVWGSSSVARA